MNYLDKFSIFIDRFECAVEIIKEKGATPSIRNWNLDVTPDCRWILKPITPGIFVDPTAFMLHGRPVDSLVYGKRSAASLVQFARNNYPYMQIEKQFIFPQSIIQNGFREGFTNDRGYKNVYLNKGSIEKETAFDVGRYLMSKHLGIKLPYNPRPPLFK